MEFIAGLLMIIFLWLASLLVLVLTFGIYDWISWKSCYSKYEDVKYDFWWWCKIKYKDKYISEELYKLAFEKNLNINE